jgi:hypothetical protein
VRTERTRWTANAWRMGFAIVNTVGGRAEGVAVGAEADDGSAIPKETAYLDAACARHGHHQKKKDKSKDESYRRRLTNPFQVEPPTHRTNIPQPINHNRRRALQYAR